MAIQAEISRALSAMESFREEYEENEDFPHGYVNRVTGSLTALQNYIEDHENGE